MRALALPGPLLSLIAPLFAVMRHLNRQLAYSDETIERVAVDDPLALRAELSISPPLVGLHLPVVFFNPA